MNNLGVSLRSAFFLMICQGVNAHAAPSNGISLTVTVDDSTPPACGTDHTWSATVGDRINVCYVVTNNSATALNYQTLADSGSGTIFSMEAQSIAPGASFQYNRVVTAVASQTSTATWTAANALGGYATPNIGTYAFVDITGAGTALGLGDDQSVLVTMPFSFDTYGIPSNQACISNNGGIAFGECFSQELWPTNTSLPNTYLPTLILPLWDDLDGVATGGDVYYATEGVAPNRHFIVEWFNKKHFPASQSPNRVTFELILEEGTGGFSFQYKSMAFGAPGLGWDYGGDATIGLQSFHGALVDQYAFHTNQAAGNHTALHWTAVAHIAYTASDTVTLDVGDARISTDASLAGTAQQGTLTTTTLHIGNTGNRDLHWNLNEADAGAPITPSYAQPPNLQPRHPHAEASLGPAPVQHQVRVDSASKLTQPSNQNLFVVPAFASDSISQNYVTLDALDPRNTLTAITSAAPTAYVAGDFIDNDFTKEYVIDPNTNELGTIDTVTGVFTDIGGPVTPPQGVWESLKWDPTTHTLYGVSTDCSNTSQLATIDPVSATMTNLGSLGITCIVSLAVDPTTGAMYGLDLFDSAFLSIDKTLATQPFVIGSIGFNANFAQAMDFDDSTGILYYAGFDRDSGVDSMYTIDTRTGLATLIAPVGSGAPMAHELTAFAVATPKGPCGTSNDVPWMSEDSTSGTTAPGATSLVMLTFDATALTPGTYNADICVHSNGPGNKATVVPVTLTVTAGDTIFKNGFD